MKGYKIELNKIPMQLSHRPTNINKDQTKVLDKLIKSFEYLEKGIIRSSQMIIVTVNLFIMFSLSPSLMDHKDLF